MANPPLFLSSVSHGEDSGGLLSALRLVITSLFAFCVCGTTALEVVAR
jgi:hypothetical protein